MSNQLRSHYDIVINGGGIVGFTLLNLILKSPYLNRYKVLLIEQAAKPHSFKQSARSTEQSSTSEYNESCDSKKFSNRVSSIIPSSKRTFMDLGVWDKIRQYTKDVHNIKVWGYNYDHRIVFEPTKYKSNLSSEEPSIMFSVVENNRLSLALLDNIYKTTLDEPVILWNTHLKHLEPSTKHDNLVSVTFQDKQTGEESVVDASLLLGCDGSKSKVRDLAKMKYVEQDLKLTAVVGTVKMENQSDDNKIAYQRFSPEKNTVAALLPLDREYSSFVISAPNAYAKYLTDCDNDEFCQEFNRLLLNLENPQGIFLKGFHGLSNGVGDILNTLCQTLKWSQAEGDFLSGGFEEPPRLESLVAESRASFPLACGAAIDMIARLPGMKHAQIAVLGDSAHRVHPLAGQGLNLGIQDTVELVTLLEVISKQGLRIFDQSNLVALDAALRRFGRKRQFYTVPMMFGIAGMPTLFSLLPSRVLSTVNSCESLKALSVKFANGRFN